VTGVIDVKPLLEATYPLDQFAEAFERARTGLKVLLIP
jgi:hypothetical protein